VARGRHREIALWRTRPGHHGISLRECPWLLEAFACLFLFSLAAGGGRDSRLVAGQAQRLLFAAAFPERPLLVVTVRDAPCLSAASAWRDSEALPGLYRFLLVDIEKHRILLEASSQAHS